MNPLTIRVVPVGPLETNCYIVSCPGSADAAVIDPGWSGDELYELATQEGVQIKALLLTHGHFDHMGGTATLKRLTGAALYAHPDAAAALADAHLHAQLWGFRVEPAPAPDFRLEDGQVVSVGAIRLEVLHTPGHAPGHVCFLERRAGAVFDGDVLFNRGIGRADLAGGDHEVLLRSIRERLLPLPDDTVVYAGHGQVTTIGDERRWNPFLR